MCITQAGDEMGTNNEFKQMVKRLRKEGYERKRQTGSHIIYSNGNDTVVINLKLNRMVAKRIEKEITNEKIHD